ncbi:uncharacterized protein THITE_2122598, partial [Thermothielavioides terrestris NRRL 8126]
MGKRSYLMLLTLYLGVLYFVTIHGRLALFAPSSHPRPVHTYGAGSWPNTPAVDVDEQWHVATASCRPPLGCKPPREPDREPYLP